MSRHQSLIPLVLASGACFQDEQEKCKTASFSAELPHLYRLTLAAIFLAVLGFYTIKSLRLQIAM